MKLTKTHVKSSGSERNLAPMLRDGVYSGKLQSCYATDPRFAGLSQAGLQQLLCKQETHVVWYIYYIMFVRAQIYKQGT